MIIICVYRFELFFQVSDVAHGSLVFNAFLNEGYNNTYLYLMSNFSLNRFFDIVFILLKVSTDEEKEKGCLSLAPGMLDILDKNTQETSSGVNVNVVPDQSNVTSPKEENHAVDIASSLPSSSTEGTLNSNTDEVVDDTDPAVNESNQPINNSTAAADVSPDTERSYATLEQNIDLNGCVASVNMDNLKMLSLLDFAGHSAYYACHHIFFSPRAFFILVVDMTKELSSIATEACRKEGLIYSEWTYAGRLRFLF